MGNWLINTLLSQLLGWGEEELATNGNRIKVAIAGGVLAGLSKLAVLVLHGSIPPDLMPQAQALADWVANAVLAGAGALVAAWTVRPAGAPTVPAAPSATSTPAAPSVVVK